MYNLQHHPVKQKSCVRACVNLRACAQLCNPEPLLMPISAEAHARGAISPRHPRTPHLPCTRHQPSFADVLCLSPSQVCESCGRCPDIMTLQGRYLLEVDAGGAQGRGANRRGAHR